MGVVSLEDGNGKWEERKEWGKGGGRIRPDLRSCFRDDGEATVVVGESDPGYFSEGGEGCCELCRHELVNGRSDGDKSHLRRSECSVRKS